MVAARTLRERLCSVTQLMAAAGESKVDGRLLSMPVMLGSAAAVHACGEAVGGGAVAVRKCGVLSGANREQQLMDARNEMHPGNDMLSWDE